MGDILNRLGFQDLTVGAKRPYHPLIHSPYGPRSKEAWIDEIRYVFDTGFDPGSAHFTDWLFDSIGYSESHKRRLRKMLAIESKYVGNTLWVLSTIFNACVRIGRSGDIYNIIEEALNEFRDAGYTIGSIEDWTAINQELIHQDYKTYLLALKKLFPKHVPYPLREQIIQIWQVDEIPDEIKLLLDSRTWSLSIVDTQYAAGLAYHSFQSEMEAAETSMTEESWELIPIMPIIIDNEAWLTPTETGPKLIWGWEIPAKASMNGIEEIEAWVGHSRE